ncbi:MAG: hypothetical protein BGO78_03715 [Chloroflexi bacterium 44-23]|nr:MAG: hypothetical protein BGO78_03715 [Chloroflexi bacterium 44-23]
MKNEENKKIEVLVTYSLSEDLVQQLATVDKRLQIHINPAKNVNDISDDLWQKTEILITGNLLPPLEKVPNLKWIQFNSAGIDFAVNDPLLKKPNLAVTNLSGAAAPQVAEFVLMAMLALGHKVNTILHQQRNHEWSPDRYSRLIPKELRGSTLGLVGYGSIGREIARITHPLGVKVLATKHDSMDPKDRGFNLEGLGDPEGNFFTRLYPIQAVGSMLKECDFVVISLPKTEATTHIIAEKELGSMKSSAYLVDISRGGVVKPQALKSALQEKKIAGAFMDVFEQEPLPKDSPLWELPNMIISPHIAGISVNYNERAIKLIVENLQNYCQDRPLFNLFDRENGY